MPMRQRSLRKVCRHVVLVLIRLGLERYQLLGRIAHLDAMPLSRFQLGLKRCGLNHQLPHVHPRSGPDMCLQNEAENASNVETEQKLCIVSPGIHSVHLWGASACRYL